MEDRSLFIVRREITLTKYYYLGDTETKPLFPQTTVCSPAVLLNQALLLLLKD